MRKDRILERDHKDYVRAERDVLTAVLHPYIVTLRYSFQVGAGTDTTASCWAGGRMLVGEAQAHAGVSRACTCIAQQPVCRGAGRLQPSWAMLKRCCFHCPLPSIIPSLPLPLPPPTHQTPKKLYLVLDFINGGHLFFQLYRQVGPRCAWWLGGPNKLAGRASRVARALGHRLAACNCHASPAHP